MNKFLIRNVISLQKYAAIVAVAGISTVFTSCLKENNDAQPVRDVAAVSVINTSPTAKTLNLFLDDNRLNNAGVPYLQGVPYVRAYTGSRIIKAFDNSTANTELARKTINLAVDKYFSVYVVGTGTGTDSLTFVLTEDKLQTPATGKVRIRFANLSPGSAPLDMGIDGQTAFFTNQAYKAVADFIEVDPINGTLVIKDKATGALVAKRENVKLDAGRNYTIFAKGAASATVNDLKPGIHIIDHNNL